MKRTGIDTLLALDTEIVLVMVLPDDSVVRRVIAAQIDLERSRLTEIKLQQLNEATIDLPFEPIDIDLPMISTKAKPVRKENEKFYDQFYRGGHRRK